MVSGYFPFDFNHARLPSEHSFVARYIAADGTPIVITRASALDVGQSLLAQTCTEQLPTDTEWMPHSTTTLWRTVKPLRPNTLLNDSINRLEKTPGIALPKQH